MMMDSSSAQDQHQEMGSQTLESMLGCTIPQQQEKKPRPSDQQSLKCPRCDSANTKFCYYNNYSLSQPRYFCKSCRRYWTKGGTLRNVPVGGGCRKNKRSSSSSSSSSSLSSSKKSQDPIATVNPNNIPSLSSYDSNDLTLAIARLQNHGHDHHFSILGNHHPNMTHQQSHHVMGGTSSGYFLENATGGFQNMYYGNNGSLGMELSGVNNQDLGIMGFDNHQEFNNGVTSSAISTAVTTVKQENIIRDGDQNGGFWSFPWKNFDGNGGGNINSNNNNIGEMDSGRVNWNGIGLSNWQGLLNSPLM